MMSVTLRALRYTLYTLGALLLLVMVAVVVLRVWWPSLPAHKSRIEAFLTDRIGRPVVIQRLDARWDGWSPAFRASGLRLRRPDGTHSSLRLGGLELQVSPWSLLAGHLIFERFTVLAPTLDVVRLKDGRLRVGGLVPGAGDAQGSAFVRWLFQQHEIRLEDGTLIWRDEREPSAFLQLSAIEMRFVNRGDSHQFVGIARCRRPVCDRISLSAELDGEPIHSAWGGRVQVNLTDVKLGNVPLAVRERIPNLVRGRLTARLSSEWQNGELAEATTRLSLSQAELFLGKEAPLRRVDDLNANLLWVRQAQGWQLAMSGLSLMLDGEDFALDRVSMTRARDRTSLFLARMDIETVMRAARALMAGDLRLDRIERVEPSGVLRDVSLALQGPLLAPTGWRLDGGFAGLSVEVSDDWPGIHAVDGSFSVAPGNGWLMLNGSDVKFDFPRFFDTPIVFAQLRGEVGVSNTNGGWQIDARRLRVRNEDLDVSSTQVMLRLGDQDQPAPYIDLRLDVPHVEVAAIPKYLPKQTPPKTTRWLKRAMAGGRISNGQVVWRGVPEHFPYEYGGGEFSARLQVTDGVFDYAPKWPPVSELNAKVEFNNATLKATSESAQLMHSRVRESMVRGVNLYDRSRTLTIHATADSPVADVVEFLSKGPLNKDARSLGPELQGSGIGELRLKVDLSPSNPKQAQVQGAYTTQDGRLQWPNGVALEDIHGTLQFTQDTVSGQDVVGQLLGGPVSLDIATVQPRRPPLFAIDARGNSDVQRLRPILGQRFVEPLSGSAAWQGRLVVDRGDAELSISSDLVGVASVLPDPLRKPSDHAVPLSAKIRYEGREARTTWFELAQRLKGDLAFSVAETGYWQLRSGQLVLGAGTLTPPAVEELWFRANVPSLDADAWLSVLRQKSGTASNRPTMADALRRVDLNVDALMMFNRDFGRTRLQATSQDGRNWQGRLDGEAVAGRARARLDERQAWYGLELEHLHWRNAAANRAQTAPARDPTQMPTVTLQADSFQFGDMSLGQLLFKAVPVANGWRITEVRCEQPELLIEGAGLWRHSATRQEMEIKLKMESQDVGQAMAVLGMAGQIGGGSGNLSASLTWGGGPDAFGYGRLSGEFAISAKKGRFLRLEPGSGRLFGLLNIEALTRRLTLDFSDIFAKGLAFDRIDGNGTLQQGDLFSDGFYVISPSALIDVRGRAGLGKEDYDMEIVVAPQLGANLGLLSAIASPAAGAVVFVMQKLLKKQIAQLVHYRYQVTGPWSSPEIVRIKQEPQIEELEDIADQP